MKIVLRQSIIIITKISFFELIEKAIIIQLLLICYLIISLKIQPYKNSKLNQVDLQLNVISIVIILLCIYSNETSSDDKGFILAYLIFFIKIFSLSKISD